MSKSVEFVKPEVNISLRTGDESSIQHLLKSVANQRPRSSKICTIPLPKWVPVKALNLIADYTRFHVARGRSDKELKVFDQKLMRTDKKTLCGMAVVAATLENNKLLYLICKALSLEFQGKTPEDILQIFLKPEDLTMEEILERLEHGTSHPNSLLSNKLCAKKQTMEEKKKMKNVEVGEELKEERSISDLLTFINGTKEETGGSSNNKKKNKRRKNKAKDSPKNANQNQDEVDKYYASLDPALMEKIDREVAEFEWRVNLDKHVRVKIVFPNKKLCECM